MRPQCRPGWPYRRTVSGTADLGVAGGGDAGVAAGAGAVAGAAAAAEVDADGAAGAASVDVRVGADVDAVGSAASDMTLACVGSGLREQSERESLSAALSDVAESRPLTRLTSSMHAYDMQGEL